VLTNLTIGQNQMTLGEKIKQLRTGNKLTQMELANLIDIHYTHIGKYESNQQMPSTETIKKIADYFDVSIDYLLDDKAEATTKTTFQDEDMLKQYKEIEKLPENDKIIIKEIINAFLVKNQIKQLVK
jgi:transcriptional regulator with XRE-family HTH domain